MNRAPGGYEAGIALKAGTAAKAVPSGPEWCHEIKYDGHRVRLEHDGNRVRQISHNGYDWTGRYPWIWRLRTGGEAWCSASTAFLTSTRCIRESTITRCSS